MLLNRFQKMFSAKKKKKKVSQFMFCAFFGALLFSTSKFLHAYKGNWIKQVKKMENGNWIKTG